MTGNFDRRAHDYDRFAGVQRTCADRLIALLPDIAGRVVDIGCGTGYLAERLATGRKIASVTLVDRSRAMVQIAEHRLTSASDVAVRAVTGDFLSHAFEPSFDLAVSASTFQWFVDFDRAFVATRRLLVRGGVCGVCLFVDGSFRELRDAFRAAGVDHRGRILDFPADDRVIDSCRGAGFEIIATADEEIAEPHDTPVRFLRRLKSIGAAPFGPEAMNAGDLRRVLNAYAPAPHGVTATYRVRYIVARNPE